MRIRTVLTAIAAAAVAAAPFGAVQARSSMPAEAESELGGSVSTFAGIGIFVAIVTAIYFIAEADEDDPVSP